MKLEQAQRIATTLKRLQDATGEEWVLVDKGRILTYSTEVVLIPNVLTLCLEFQDAYHLNGELTLLFKSGSGDELDRDSIEWENLEWQVTQALRKKLQDMGETALALADKLNERAFADEEQT